MHQLGDDLDLLDEILDLFVDAALALLPEFLDRNVGAQVFAFVDLPEAAFADYVLRLDVFRVDVEFLVDPIDLQPFKHLIF